MSSLNTDSKRIGLGCSRFARRYSGNRFCFLFLRLLRCFNSPGCLFPNYEFYRKFKWLPYSGISGSKLVASSPERFAGICALLRLWVPRSPPFALSHLTNLYRCRDAFVILHSYLNKFSLSLVMVINHNQCAALRLCLQRSRR